MAWNGARHLAAWYGAAGMGAVLHTLNPRLFLEQIAYIANHAGDRLLIADPATADLVEQLLPQVPSIEARHPAAAPAPTEPAGSPAEA